ncbi:MAG TPA: hypothetical protein VK662_00800 [Acidothermaceae bacterium]|nr:hypothetical protein [Acidothermaceae bacterium]
MPATRRGKRITVAIVVLTACAACASHPIAAPGRSDPSAAPANSAPASSAPSASSIAAPASSAAASMTPTGADPAGFVDWRIVPCPAANTCRWPTQDEPNTLVLYSTATGDVVRTVASASGAGVELAPVASDYDPQWHYFLQQSGQTDAAPPTVNALMRVPATGGEPQVVVPNLVQPDLVRAADNYVVSTDGHKVAYLGSGDATSVMVATIGDHPTHTKIDLPADDSMLQLAGWLPDDRTVVAVLPTEDATPGRLVEFDTTAPFALKTIFAAPWPVAYSHDECPDEELAAAVDGETIALAVGACSAETTEPTPELYFLDAAGNHGPPVAVVAHTPYSGGFSVYGVQFASDDEVVVLLAHQDCYGTGVSAAVTKSGASHYIPVQGDGCGG